MQHFSLALVAFLVKLYQVSCIYSSILKKSFKTLTRPHKTLNTKKINTNTFFRSEADTCRATSDSAQASDDDSPTTHTWASPSVLPSPHHTSHHSSWWGQWGGGQQAERVRTSASDCRGFRSSPGQRDPRLRPCSQQSSTQRSRSANSLYRR